MEHAGNGCHAADKHYGPVYEFAGVFLRVCVHVCVCVLVFVYELCEYIDVYICMFTYVLEALRYKPQGRWFGSLRCH